jgi:cell division protein FtsN
MARRPQNSRRREPAPGWVWMLFGVGLGLLVAIGVYLRSPRTPATAAAAPIPAAAPLARAEKKAERNEKTAPKPVPSTTAADDEKRFQFYDILPQFEVVVPKGEPRGSAPTPAARAAPVQQPGRYLLQAGSFSTPAEADRLQAKLGLHGIESRVQQATVDNNVFYRVQIGPIDELDALNRTRRQLADAGIEALPLKLRE